MESKRKSRLKDIAEVCGVGISTVSAAIHNTGYVSDEKKQKILKCAQEMQYEKNLFAQLLKQKNNYDIGLIITEIPSRVIGSGYFQPMISNFIQHCEAENIRCQIEYHNPVAHRDKIPALLANGLAGGVLHGGFITPKIRKWLKSNYDFPFVAFEEDYKYCITSNYDEAFYKGIQYMVALGHKRFGLIAAKEKYNMQRQIRHGFMRAVNDFNLETRNEWITRMSLENDMETVKRAVDWTRKLLEQPAKPSAIICCDGRVAKGLLYAVCEAGIKVPDDLSILACSSKIESEQIYPPLSSICWNAPEAIFKGINILNNIMKKKKCFSTKLFIEPIITQRNSISKCKVNP